MKIAAIISEYNPFHKGHEYQTELLRQGGYDIIIAIMSGSVVQRGELACADKLSRAKAAVLCGVDIVIEIPAPFSSSSAEYFAYAGVFAAGVMGADVLSFGSECGDLSLLDSHASIERQAKAGEGAARSELEGTYFLSNDILAIEYLRAIKKLKLDITPLTHKRIGEGYNSQSTENEYLSASGIRLLAREKNFSSLEKALPKKSGEVLIKSFVNADFDRRDDILFSMIASKFIYSDEKLLSSFAFLSGGLAERMKKSIDKAMTLEEFYSLAATKVYTNGRIRRASISALCEVPAAAMRKTPEYLTLLAASGKGREYLSAQSFSLEICSNIRQKKKYSSFEYEKRFDSLYSFVSREEFGRIEQYFNKSPYIHQS